MRAYLAAPYAARDQVNEYASQLEAIGYTISSTWLNETVEINAGTIGPATAIDDAQARAHCNKDFDDLEESDLLVLLTCEALGIDGSSGGRHVETGYFMSHRGPQCVIVVGQPENIFHRAAGVTVVPDWHTAVIELAARLAAHERNRPTG